MKRIFFVLTASSLLAGPLAAHSNDSDQTAEKPEMCEMMHDGEKMQGMMMRGEDGTMTCQMMDHPEMEHGQMEHGHMEHGHMGSADAGADGTASDETAQTDATAEDHSSHQGHAAD